MCLRGKQLCSATALIFKADGCPLQSLQDAYAKGYDVMLLSDCSATSSPDHAQQTIEYNVS